MKKYSIKLSIIHISLITALILITNIVAAVSFSASPSTATSAQKQQVTITAALDYLGDAKRWDIVLQPALQELRSRHPDIDIQLDYRAFEYSNERTQFLEAMANQTSIDIMSVDQIWLENLLKKDF
jgi:ABC-type glycerol-3-phosphate transport system substrate-binding protein